MIILKAAWQNFITSGIQTPLTDTDRRRVILINTVSFFSVIIETFFGTLNLSNQNLTAATIELVSVFAMLVNLITLRRHRNINLAARVLITAVSTPLMIILINTQSYNTSLFWLPMLPVVAYLLLGKKQGSTVLLILFLTIGLLTLLESFSLVQLAYSFTSLRQLILSLLVLAVLLYVHEDLRDQSMLAAGQKASALSLAYKKIQHGEKMRDEFTAVLANELRDALIGIQKIAQTWRGQTKTISPTKSKEYLNLIDESVTENLAVVTSLLDVQNIDVGNFKLNLKLHSLREIIEHQLTISIAEAHQKKIIIKQQIDSELPWQILIDSFRVKQALANLLSNAIKHTASGETITIHALQAVNYAHLKEKMKLLNVKWYLSDQHNSQLKPLTDFVLISISHPEAGINQADINQLFQKFSNIGSTDKNHLPSRYGLGLYLVRRIIESHHGTYGVGSIPNQGVTFYFTLPNKHEHSTT